MKAQRGFLPAMPLFLRPDWPELHAGAIEVVIYSAAEDAAREAVIQAAREAYNILSLPSVKFFSGSQKLVDALDAAAKGGEA